MHLDARYNEILKFGAMIVDALVDYEHPIFIYIPKHGELRGGAWAARPFASTSFPFGKVSQGVYMAFICFFTLCLMSFPWAFK